ncbi:MULTISPECIES: M20/M25/M40 family metallo-hydrolase [Bradyrhizobium]|uniref:M20/M25/M40 family metallo-hydrolase n=1 Tax=Bradyrhizobium TaxID=374 RepID=UPI001304BFA2|nr:MULTISPECIES: M20/M25/M40 family metallo-hydrolase [Bradyrhizobium]MCA1416660.1 M20/M25/M40 family metallo-hydrolase [Bradyrhizobium sp. NBAIM20]MCA1466218.1 M20/M25/M40 family metallo-hydrolase [Bradyrhizobium sp. NBAIM18]MCA1530413.1 M20/M25/M40 family metallo-hydrolase [Bradyrhizobium yuanmingense]
MKGMSGSKTILTALAMLLVGGPYTYAQSSRLWVVTSDNVAAAAQRSLASRQSVADDLVVPTFQVINGMSVADIAEKDLDRFSNWMRSACPRCGGFTVHASREAALKEVDNPAYKPGFRYLAPLPETLDQQSAVRRALERVKGDKILNTITMLQGFGTRHFETSKGQEAAEFVRREWESMGQERPDFTVALFSHGWVQNSVIGTIRGASRPDEVVVIGAHIDSINWKNKDNPKENAPGADDDASGVAVVTEALRVLMETGFKPQRTIKFMAYSAEEVGLRGSAEIADRYAAESKGQKVIAALQFDMTGFNSGRDTRDIYLVNQYTSPELNGFLTKLLKEYNHSGAHAITHGETKGCYACSDHASWTRNGIRAAWPFEAPLKESNPYIHTSEDVVSKLDATKAARFAKLAIEFLIETAKGVDGRESYRN